MKDYVRSAALLSLLPVVLVGCGPEKEAAHPDQGHEHGPGPGHEHGPGHEPGHEGAGHEHGPGHEHGEPKMEGALKSLHDVLAPVYHAEKGPGRADKACAATGSIKGEAAKVAAEPKGDPAAWKTASDALAKTVGDLEAACKGDKAGVEPALEKVHEAFHVLLEKAKG